MSSSAISIISTPKRSRSDHTSRRTTRNMSPQFAARVCCAARRAETDDPTVEAALGRVGKQMIENTGPLNRKRMETIDEETTAAANDFINRQVQAGKPFFVLQFDAHAHLHPCAKSMRGKSGMPGDNTPTAWSRTTATSARCSRCSMISASPTTRSWSTRPTTARAVHLAGRGNDTVQGREGHQLGRRLPRPALIRWPGRIKPGSIERHVCGLDFIPTLLAAAGNANDRGTEERHQR